MLTLCQRNSSKIRFLKLSHTLCVVFFMVIRCPEQCGIAFDQDAYGASQMVAHLWGSHGKGASEAEFLPDHMPQEIPVVSKAETVETYAMEPKVAEVKEVMQPITPPVKKKK